MKKSQIFILLLIMLLSKGNALCQLNYKEGRVITMNNDTVYGLIRDNGSIRNSKVCLFKEYKGGLTTKFYPKDIKSYLIFGDKYFVSQEIFHKNKFDDYFLEVLVEGNIRLCYFYKNDDIKYYIHRDNEEIIPLINERYLSAKPRGDFTPLLWQEYQIDNNLYKDTLYSLIGDNNDLLRKLIKLEYKHKSLIAFTKDYIAADCEEESCVTFERNLYKTKDKFGFLFGTSFILSSGVDPFQMAFPVGIFYNIPIALISERFSIQPELQYFFTFDQIESPMFQIPLSFRYQLFSRRLSPFIGIGKELMFFIYSEPDLVKKRSLLMDFGFNYDLKPRLTLFTNLRYQYYYLEYGGASVNFRENIDKTTSAMNLLSIQFGIMF